eukprot:CAMPEP_0202688336 /NCGR_PEP_ID=MMETSP1385-20130828/3858_1 /ASSEMBLY_ACC=CAM_ASM_000861 /TAXON_ID=933848 /ORGANISM="Elphidium margaritaceum" /LENGTH=291 /DNA_ID=CAMNT_0049343287 /DNA_START=24 /DNA_END=899 /DNA_ORIENTATION=+
MSDTDLSQEAGNSTVIDNNDIPEPNVQNPFLKLSDEKLAETWTPSNIVNAAKTWRSTLTDKQQKQSLFLQDFLNAVLPPPLSSYSMVSTQASTRAELTALRQKFEQSIQERKARQTGIDSIRTQLAYQLFDELIRQTSIDCKERGLLLLRLRDESKMTLQTYGILKQVATTFSINEGVQSDQGFEELMASKQTLMAKKKELETKRLQLQNTLRDKQKECEIVETVLAEHCEEHIMALNKESTHLRLLIDAKSRRAGGNRNKRRSISSARNRSRILSAKDLNASTFSFMSTE